MESIKVHNNLYVVICGHVDSGKSTLTGHLLFEYGMVDKKILHKYELQSLFYPNNLGTRKNPLK